MIPQRLLRIVWVAMLASVAVGELLPSWSAPKRLMDRLDASGTTLHFAAYLALMFLPALHESRWVRAGMAAGIVSFGVALELLQRTMGRSCDVWDIVANTAGVLCGLAAAGIFRPKLGWSGAGLIGGEDL